MSLRITINDNRLRAKLSDLDGVLEDIVGDFLNVIGAELEREMKLEAPVDTGWLRSNIVYVVKGGVMIAGVDDLAPYGKFVALGTRRQAPNPFHLRALETVRGEITTILRDAVESRTAAFR